MHLGYPNYRDSREREKRFVSWLDNIKNDAEEIVLLGDIFDFWFEYKRVIPRGFTRFLGKIAEITDSGIPVHFFTGNHDIWVFDYLEDEIGVKVYRKPVVKDFFGKKFFLAHGDGLGNYDKGFSFLKSIFTSPFMQWVFARFHPNFGVGLAHKWSGHSRKKHEEPDAYRGDDKEWIYLFTKDYLENNNKINYFVYGHRHLLLQKQIDKAQMIILGDWLLNFSYGIFDGNEFRLEKYK